MQPLLALQSFVMVKYVHWNKLKRIDTNTCQNTFPLFSSDKKFTQASGGSPILHLL